MYKKININSNNIKTYSSKAVLIMCPNNSEYKGYCFWHPIKLFDTGVHGSSNMKVEIDMEEFERKYL